MKMMACRIAAALVAVALSIAPAFAADPFPSHPIRIIVNTGPGGLTDVVTRMVARQMGEQLKQSVVVENRAGGDGLIGIRYVQSAPADGYTLLASAGTIAFQTAFKADPGFELKDFTGIGMMGRSPLVLVESPTLPDKTLTEFIVNAKANPDKLSFASAGVGTGTHLAAEYFLQDTGIKLLHVPYKGNGPAMPDVMSGRVNVIFEAYGSSGAQIKAGKLRALGISSEHRFPGLPEVPTIAEQGVPGYSFYTWLTLLTPAATPMEVVQALAKALHGATTSPVLAERFKQEGIEAMDMSPQQLNDYMASQAAQAAKLVEKLGMQKQ